MVKLTINDGTSNGIKKEIEICREMMISARFTAEFTEAVCRKMEERGYGISLLQETILELWYGITDADGEIWDSESAEEFGVKYKEVNRKCFGTLYGGAFGSFGDFGNRFPSKSYKKLNDIMKEKRMGRWEDYPF